MPVGTGAHNVPALAEMLRGFRVQRGLSKVGLSRMAGLSASYVGKLEAGNIDPSLRAFAAIALALELTSHEVFFCVRCLFVETRAAIGAGEGVPSHDES